MLVLHASLGPDDHVFVWAEASSDAFADAAQLERVLGNAGRPTAVAVTLPAVDRVAVASPECARVVGRSPAPFDAGTVTCGRRTVAAVSMEPGELVDAVAQLAGADGVLLGSDLHALLDLARHAAALVVRQEYLPDVRFERPGDGGPAELHARWSPLATDALGAALDAAIAAAPGAIGALSSGRELEEPVPVRARRFVADVVDDLVRRRITSGGAPRLVAMTPSRAESMHDRWMRGLVTPLSRVDGPQDALDRLAAQVADWQQRLRRREQSPWRLRLQLEEPDEPAASDGQAGAAWTLRYLVQLRADPSVVVPAAAAWTPTGSDRTVLEANGFHAGEHLLAPLAEAAQLFEPIADSLGATQPASCELTTAQAHRFLAEVVALLEPTGVSVTVPSWWTGGRPRVSMRARLVTQLHGGRQHMDSLNLATLVGYDWRVAIGDAELTRDELTRLAAQKTPLVHVRGRWMELDDAALRAAIAHLERAGDEPRFATIADLVRMSVGAAPDIDGVPVSGVDGADGDDVAQLLAGVARGEPVELPDPPVGLDATLRPYQLRGYQWLVSMANLGLGSCLADDMGLGKTVQVLAAIQHAWERDADGRAPTLVVCPTSVLTNWQRETQRFTPDLPAFVHHGGTRVRDADFVALAACQAVVFTSYALLSRDVEQLRRVGWRMVVLDEAQNVKNPGTRHARAARSLVAPARVALTGTPVENHAGDLWSIMEFLNPGLLGSQADFRRKYLIPIQTGTFPEATARLRQVVAPFLLRREKVDPDVIADLPDKLEQVAWCHLTTEQVSLYEAIVREAAQTLRMAPGQARRSGIERRGLILATISRLKQVCNHPAQLLADHSRIGGRSGKLERLEGLLETVLDRGERALVFTQFVAMGELLQQRLRQVFGRDVPFLHGGTSRTERDRMVERFQDPSADAPPILLLSLKAGGSGLNLTAATHVVHFDRWWNPATEQQATDRAFRIGQTRDVQVHALVCSGTVEERIDLMLRQKQGVAASLVGSGEQWITELDDADLIELLTLRRDTMLQDGRLDHLDPKEWQRGSL